MPVTLAFDCGGKYSQYIPIPHSRSLQDDYAIRSYERALAAQAAGVFAKEIVPVSVPSERRKGEPTLVEQDEGLGKVSRPFALGPNNLFEVNEKQHND